MPVRLTGRLLASAKIAEFSSSIVISIALVSSDTIFKTWNPKQ
jgi:hypothetical protein